MATNDELIKLILQIQGQEEASKLRGTFSDLKEEILKLGTTLTATDPKMVALAKQMNDAGEAADKLEKKFGRGNGGLTNAIQGSSRAFQDFTSASLNGGLAQGFGAITNNVDQMVTGFAKLAGVSTTTATTLASFGTFAVVGLQLAIPIIQSLAKEMGLFKEAVDKTKPEIEVLKDKIKTLNDKPIKLTVDRTELAAAEADMKRLIKAQKDFDEIKDLKSKATQASESAIREAIAEAPGEGKGVAADLKKAIGGDIVNKDPGMAITNNELAAKQKELAELRGRGAGATAGGREAIFDLRKEIKDLEFKKGGQFDALMVGGGHVEKEVGKLVSGDMGFDARDSALRKAGRGGLADQLRKLTPEKMAESEEINRVGDLADDLAISSGKAASKGVKERKAARDKHRKEYLATSKLLDEDEKQDAESKTKEGNKETAAQKLIDNANRARGVKTDAEAEANARRLPGGQEAEAYIANEALRRAQFNSMPRHLQATAKREMALNGNPILSKDEAESRAQQMMFDRSAGMTDANGNKLSDSQRGKAAIAATGDATARITQKLMALQGVNGNQVLNLQAIVGEMQGTLQQLDMQSQQMVQNGGRVQTAQRRGRR